MEYILCVGDSLTFGARDEFHSGYPAELSRLFWVKEKRKIYCVNCGISGETSSQLLRRIYFNSRSCSQAKVALLLIGSNDTFLPQDPEIYYDNLRQTIMILQEGERKVVIGLLPPIIGPGLPNYPIDAQKQVDVLNKKIIAVASDMHCSLADFRGLGKYIIDTVHFGHEGYAKMAEIWYDALKKEKLCS
jgi:lysophospholipase L1-like esterase